MFYCCIIVFFIMFFFMPAGFAKAAMASTVPNQPLDSGQKLMLLGSFALAVGLEVFVIGLTIHHRIYQLKDAGPASIAGLVVGVLAMGALLAYFWRKAGATDGQAMAWHGALVTLAILGGICVLSLVGVLLSLGGIGRTEDFAGVMAIAAVLCVAVGAAAKVIKDHGVKVKKVV